MYSTIDWHETRFAAMQEGIVLPCVPGTECIGVLVKSGFAATEEADGIVWLERDACGVLVPRDEALDARELEVILQSARIDDGRFCDLLAQVRLSS